ncbi:MAG TPA: hypothetical protein VMZ06_12435 [Candidatus Bathyarchaeia archaeon]|nr:hypothetical protein [Candidatus Bathyarchaeia archaeon]
MNMSEETIRELIREEIANAPSAMLAPRRETNPTPFAVGPVATMSGGFRDVTGVVENFAKEYETNATLLKVFAHGEGDEGGNHITVYKGGLYLIFLNARMHVPLYSDDPIGSAQMRVAINATDGSGLRDPGLMLMPTPNPTEATESALPADHPHTHVFKFKYSSITLAGGVPDIVLLEKDDEIRAYLTAQADTPSAYVQTFYVRLSVMFLCPHPPTS